MEGKRESKLQHIMKVSWESEHMPGWEDSLTMILEENQKQFSKGNKNIIEQNTGKNFLEKYTSVLEEDFSL